MLNNKALQVLKRIRKEAPEARPVLNNYIVKDAVLYMTDGEKLVWTPTEIKDGLYTIEGENVTETAGAYPDILRLIPSDYKTAIKVNDVRNLLEFVKAYVKLYGLKRSNRKPVILLSIKDDSVKLTNDSDYNDVYMSYTFDDVMMADSTVYYNPFYLIDVLEFISANNTDNTATIKYHSRVLPLVIETDNGTGALVMPIRKSK